GPEILDTDDRFRRSAVACSPRYADFHPLAGGAVFQRVFHEIFEHADELVAIAGHDYRIAWSLHHDLDAAIVRQHLHGITDLPHHGTEVDRVLRTDVGIELDPRQRQQIVDQPRHAERLLFHDGEKALARGGIIARRPLQRLDEAGERGERRPQFVAGVGDEIGTHLLDPAQRGEIADRHQYEVGTPPRPVLRR